jgi:hypothetical protein
VFILDAEVASIFFLKMQDSKTQILQKKQPVNRQCGEFLDPWQEFTPVV